MTAEELTRLKNLDETMRRDAEQLLRDEKIWLFGTFGWLNANDVDPEYLGHAMWQTDDPGDIYLTYAVVGNYSKRQRPADPEQWQVLTVISGTDFYGLMETARLTIGLLLLQARLRRDNTFHNNEYFDLHWMSSIIYLSTASDRLRDLFVNAVFHESADNYGRNGSYNGKKRRLYATPFEEAISTKKPHHGTLTEPFDRLPTMAEKICHFRKRRNEIIHEVATSMGRHTREMFKECSWKTPTLPDDGFRDIKRALQEYKQEYKDAHEKHISEIICELRDWYFLLARASNEVFIIENTLRRAAKSAR
jgi:hypothetical protein